MEDPEKSVGFLCHKFTTLFSKLKLVEEERNQQLEKTKAAEAKIEALQQQLLWSERRAESEKIQAENEIKAWRSKADASSSVLGNLKADREELEYELQMVRGRVRQMQEREMMSSEQLTDSKDKLNGLEASKAKLESEVAAMTTRLTQVSNDVVSFESECLKLRRENQNYRQLIDARDEDLRQAKQQQADELNAARCQKDELQRTCKALSTQTSRASEMANISYSMEVQMKDMKERLDALRSRNKSLEQELDTVRSCLDATQTKESELQGLVHEECLVSEKLRESAAELDAERRKALEEVAASRSECAQERARVDVLETKLDHWQDKEATHLRQLEGYREESKTSQAQIDLLQEQKCQLERVNDNLRKELKSFFVEKDRIENERKQEQAEVVHWKRKAQSILPQLDEARGRQLELERRLAKQQDDVFVEQEQKHKLQREARVSSEKIKALNRKCDQLMAQAQRSGTRQHFEKMLSRDSAATVSQRASAEIFRNSSRSAHLDEERVEASARREVAESTFDLRSLSQKNPNSGVRPIAVSHASAASGDVRDEAASSPTPVEYLCSFIQKEEERLGIAPLSGRSEDLEAASVLPQSPSAASASVFT